MQMEPKGSKLHNHNTWKIDQSAIKSKINWRIYFLAKWGARSSMAVKIWNAPPLGIEDQLLADSLGVSHVR